jgi:hypothetical protein
MKHTWTVSELAGINQAITPGEFIEDDNRDFSNRGVVVGVSILTNVDTNISSLVTGVTTTKVSAIGVSFNCGDLYKVTLATPWTMQNSDGSLIEVECNICGFSYPKDKLIRGKCKVCQDQLSKS